MEMRIIRLADLAGSPQPRSRVGGKAHYLARLHAAELPVPDALVVTTAVQGLAPEQRAAALAELEALAGALGRPLAVRSSAVMEDDVAAAAPGVFASMLDVEPADLAGAVQAVWGSAQAPLVRAYAEARGLADLAVAVIVQRQVPDGAAPGVRGVLYTRPPGQPDADEVLLEAALGPQRLSARIPRAGAAAVADAPWPASVTAALRDLGLRAEAAIGARQGADVEWVVAGEQVWLVQARPVVHPAPRPAAQAPEALFAFSRAEPELVWRLDVAHNPEPLSPAQAGLVERVDRAGLAPYRLGVVGGYLYVATPADAASGTADAADPAADPDAASLRRRFDDELAPAMDAALAPAMDADLPAALAAYERFYRIYAAELSPALSAARRRLPAFLDQLGHDGERLAGELLADGSPARLESLLARVARGDMTVDALLAEVGDLAPAWDVACPTFAETPEIVRQAVTRTSAAPAPGRAADRAREVRASLSPADAARLDRLLELARAARDIAELDDRLYARAQAAVRRALLRLAATWSVPAADIFFVPLDMVLDVLAHGHAPDPALVHRRAQAGRTAQQRQRAWSMPLAFANGRPLDQHDLGRSPGVWRGLGTGGRARGTAVRFENLAALPSLTAGAIAVTPTMTPAMAFALQGAAAIVAEHGGLLDHGAAMARELGIPCVVRCTGAWSEIRTGDTLWVDGDAGMVIRAETRAL